MTNNYLTVRQASEQFTAFSESSIRYLIFNEHTNGFHKCVKRVAGKVLISVEDFIDYIECNGGVNNV